LFIRFTYKQNYYKLLKIDRSLTDSLSIFLILISTLFEICKS